MTTANTKESTKQLVSRISDLDDEPLKFLSPISGYENVPLVSLLEAVEPLTSILPAVQSYAYAALQMRETPEDGLTQDESASITLYTMGWDPLKECLYYALNAVLRSPDRQQNLSPWYPFLRLFLGALFRLPSISNTVYRGVKLDLSKGYIKGKSIVWWGFSSCAKSIDVLESDLFLGSKDARTMFHLHCHSAKNIRNHSYYSAEDEILLLPATQFKILGYLPQGNLHIFQLEETTPLFPLLQPIPGIKSNLKTDAVTKKDDTSKVDSTKNSSDTKSQSTASASATSTKKQASLTSSVEKEVSNMNIESSSVHKVILNLPVNATWEQEGVTVAGGNGPGGNNNQLAGPYGLFVDDDDDETIVIADSNNHRIMQWKRGDTQGQVVAGGNEQGNRLDQLSYPKDVLIDKETNSLIIADPGNGRVVRWSRRSGTKQGEILIDNIWCWGLAMDEQGNLYVSDYDKNEVRRYEIDRGDKTGTVVAGGNGKGNGLDQLDFPKYLFVDRNQSLYVSDFRNHRVMKWDKGAAQGDVVVPGGQGQGSALTQLHLPSGIFVDTLGTLYVAEGGNHRVTRWPQGSEKKGTVVVGGNGRGSAANQFNGPVGLSFDKDGNLYVADYYNHRVQRFNIIK